MDWITLKAMEKDRARRYQTANAFADDIWRHLNHGPVRAGPPSTIYCLKKLARKHRGQSILAAAVTMTLALVAVVSATYTQSASRTREAERLQHGEILTAAQRLRSGGQFQEALNALEPVVGSEHVGLRATLLRARLLLELKGPGQAAGQLNELLKERDDIACQAHFLLARVYLESAGDAGAMREYRQKAAEHQNKGEQLFAETSGFHATDGTHHLPFQRSQVLPPMTVDEEYVLAILASLGDVMGEADRNCPR